jgi:hypothetical protein
MQPKRPSLIPRKPVVGDLDAFVNGGEPALALVRSADPQPLPATEPEIAATPTAPPAKPSTRPAAPRRVAEGVTFRRANRAIIERKTKPARRRTTVYLDLDLVEQLAHVCADQDREMSDAVNEAVRQFVQRKR